MREVSHYLYGLCIVLAVLALSSLHTTVQGQQQSKKPVHVLVDASKDGGLWWFPQAHTFNPKEYHQGKGFADLIRAKGWQVTELPRGGRKPRRPRRLAVNFYLPSRLNK